MKLNPINDDPPTQKFLLLRRISKKRFYFILLASILSIFVLLSQTIDFYVKGSCCESNEPDINKAFNEYGSFSLVFAKNNLEFPIAIIGIVIMFLNIIQLVFLSCIPIPFSLKVSNSSLKLDLTMNNKFIKNFYLFFLLQLLFYSILVLNLIGIELYIIKSICIPCTISQSVIFLTTLLILTWSPHKN